MSRTRVYLDQYQQLPRAAQWGMLATAFLLIFLLWSEILSPTSQAWTAEADEMEKNLVRLRGASEVPADIRAQAISFGAVHLPDLKQRGSLLLTQQVQAILANYGITDDNFTMSRPTPMSNAKSAGLTMGNEKIERLKSEVEFKTVPKTAISIIAEMESDPAFESVSNVKLDKDQAGKIRVRLTIESWVRVKRGRR